MNDCKLSIDCKISKLVLLYMIYSTYNFIFLVVDPPEIEYIDYVADIMTQPPKESESNTPTNEQKNKEQQQEAKRDEKPPITVTMRY